MAKPKKASNLASPYPAPPTPDAPLDTGPAPAVAPHAGQSYAQRISKGRREFSFWLSGTHPQLIEVLQKRLGLKNPKDVFEQAITEMAQRYLNQ